MLLHSDIKTSIAQRIINPLRRTSEHIGLYIFERLHNTYGSRVNCERSFSALGEDAFGALASLPSQSLVSTFWFIFCSQIIVVKHDFNSMLYKIVSVKVKSLLKSPVQQLQHYISYAATVVTPLHQLSNCCW